MQTLIKKIKAKIHFWLIYTALKRKGVAPAHAKIMAQQYVEFYYDVHQ